MRFLHVMLRVRNLDKSIAFYENALGMRLLRKKDYETGRFTLAFLGYGEEKDETVIELTHNWDQEDYTNGDAYGHIAIGVDDLQKSYDHMLTCGGTAKVAPRFSAAARGWRS